MQPIEGSDGTAFQCNDGEAVTYSFTPHNTDPRVTFQFQGDGGPQDADEDGFTFTMNQPKRILRVLFHFVNESGTGGSYDVTLSGSDGGTFPDPPPVEQNFDEVPARRYVFLVNPQ